jgi:energy-converting hydrogenase A subunit R
MTMPSIFFDLEGPLSPQDNAYEVLSLVKNGDKIFEVISKYDDILTIEKRRNYEPGDTLKLILPFLIHHNIREEDVGEVSEKAALVQGAKELIQILKQKWEVFIISTSYEQHALNIARKVGLDPSRVACTKMPLNKYIQGLNKKDLKIVGEMEKEILDLYPPKDETKVVKILDGFFFESLKKTKLGKIFDEIKVMGGKRKVNAMLNFKADLSSTIAVGDSITDYKMLKEVRDKGGLAIAFNGNEYSIPYSNVGVASTDLMALVPVINAFAEGGKDSALRVVAELRSDKARYDRIEGAEEKIHEIIRTHKKFRMLVRGEAGKLG